VHRRAHVLGVGECRRYRQGARVQRRHGCLGESRRSHRAGVGVQAMKQAPEGVSVLAQANMNADALVRLLIGYLDGVVRQLGFRTNRVLPKDGSEAMTSPLPLAAFTVATRPTASSWAGAIIYVSDGGAGAVFQGSNGSAWVNLG